MKMGKKMNFKNMALTSQGLRKKEKEKKEKKRTERKKEATPPPSFQQLHVAN